MRVKRRDKILIPLCFLFIIISVLGCGKVTNEYTGQSYDSVSDIAKEAREKIEDKYGMNRYDLSVLDYKTEGTTGIFANNDAAPSIHISLKDKSGKIFNAYYSSATADPRVFDDYQYDEILNDFIIANADILNDADRVSIRYNFLGFDEYNMIEDLYTGDLSIIELSKVRVEYVNRDVSDCEFNGVDQYAFISYETVDDLNRNMAEDWFSIPGNIYPVGIEAIKDKDDYAEYCRLEYGDYMFISREALTVSPAAEEFDVSNLINKGARSPRAITDTINVKCDGEYSIYYKADPILEELVKSGYTIDSSNPEVINNAPVYLGYKYVYNGDYSYHRQGASYENGYFHVHGVNPERDTMRFYIDEAYVE